MSRQISIEHMEYETQYQTTSENSNINSVYGSDCDGEYNEPSEMLQTDKEGFIIKHPGQKLGPYEISSVLGEGAYGRVFHGTNRTTGLSAALKVGRSDAKQRKAALDEILILARIKCRDPDDKSLCVKMIKWFSCNGHICIAFPALGPSVYDILKFNDFEPFNMNQVRHISYQLCSAVQFLHQNGMTHTDLKPENMLFVDTRHTIESNAEGKEVRRMIYTDIRLIDFGNVTCELDPHYPTVTTIYYRAPEVVLKLGWSYPCDVWSIACTIVEIYSGNLLFAGENERELLAIMEKTLGAIPLILTTKSNRNFVLNGKLNIKLNDEEKEVVEESKPLQEFQLFNREDDNFLFDLIKRMLEYNQLTRITLKEVLFHSYFHKLPFHQRSLDSNVRN